MNPLLKKLAVDLSSIDPKTITKEWEWLLTPDMRPLFASLVGDLFLEDGAGQIWWLDVGIGDLTLVAGSAAEFEALLADEEQRDEWFLIEFVQELREAGLKPGRGEVYCYRMLPVLGGDYVPGNMVIKPVAAHFAIWGPVHAQIKDLPDGAEVSFKIVD